MNLLLLAREELDDGGLAHLTGRRARHAHEVLRAAPGRELRIGVIDGPTGSADVLASTADRLDLRCTLEDLIEAPPGDVLLLAVPRPKVLLRCLEDAAALGFGQVVLIRTWRVDKSWLGSSALHPKAWREHLVLGLEQARRTHLPKVAVFPLFRPFVEDRLEGVVTATNRFVAHLEGAGPMHAATIATRDPFTLAIGPEGGFVPYEVDALRARGFATVTLGPHPQRVGVALSALTAQLQLLRAIQAKP